MAEPTSNCSAQTAVEKAMRDWDMAGDTTATLTIDIYSDTLLTIPYIPDNVQSLSLRGNIIHLPRLPGTLHSLDLNIYTSITFATGLPTGLIRLSCWGSCIDLPELPNGLKNLSINTDAKVLPQLPPQLEVLDIAWSHITELPPALPALLRILNCDYSGISHIIALPPALQTLHCDETALISLPTLPSTLKRLSCAESRLESLPDLPPQLEYLHCPCNNLTALPYLPASLKELTICGNKITDYPNYVEGLDIINDSDMDN
jgi:Leucine-rich repeat (LRR) protein